MQSNLIAIFFLVAICALTQDVPQAIESHELHNVWQLSPRIISGSEPEGESAFAELSRLGVKTIVSVDGIAPKVDLAKKYNLRYVHVPIGYDGIDDLAQRTLARVAKDIDGKIYVHCHHGKHRGPAAAAIVCRADDGRSAEAARLILEKAGTGKEYPGLWRDVAQFAKPTGPLPELKERAEVESLAGAMARIDRSFDRLKLLSKNKWRPLADHPDVVALSEAVQLRELFAESARVAHGGKLKQGLQAISAMARELETSITSGDPSASDELIVKLAARCTDCHVAHRNEPSTRQKN